jgi:hypothetical protein
LLSVSTENLSFTPAAGEKTVDISSNSTWNVTSGASWITITPASGTGNGTIKVTVSENTGSVRIGTVTVSGCNSTKTIAIAQEGCSLTVALESLTFATTGGEKTVDVTSNYKWNVTSDAAWLTLTPASGTGNGQLKIKAAENTATTSRNGNITVTGCGTSKTITVAQEGCSLSIDNTKIRFDVNGNPTPKRSFQISSNSNWSVSKDSPWIKVSDTSGAGNKIITVEADKNTGQGSRSGKIVVQGCDKPIEITVDQSITSVIDMDSPEITIYPNPFNDVLYIGNNDKVDRMTLINVTGQTLMDIEKPGSIIPASKLPGGFYFINLYNEEGLMKSVKAIKR